MADPAADRTRSAHAAQVLRAVSAELDDPVAVQRALWVAGPSLRRDGGLRLPQLLSLARALRDAAPEGVVTVPARFEDTAVERFILTARDLVGEVEREKMGERTTRGKIERARSGRIPQAFGQGCYGYVHNPTTG